MATDEAIWTPERTDAISTDGLPSQRFHEWIEEVARSIIDLQPIFGTGSPEAVEIANVGRFYIDTGAAVGTGIYVKESGTGDTGWILRS